MARPRSDDRRSAIILAASRVIASQGLGAPTAIIAKEAGVSNGSLFTYFETKAELLNQLYLELKSELASVALAGMPTEIEVHQQVYYMWSRWMGWATSYPEKRRALTFLGVSDYITRENHQVASQSMGGIVKLLERSRENGPMREAPLGLVVALMNALAEATIDFMIQDPANADGHCKAGFDAMWRMIA